MIELMVVLFLLINVFFAYGEYGFSFKGSCSYSR